MKLALRSLLKTPGFTVVALLTLALGIGLNVCSFTVLNTLFSHPLPYPEQDRLVRLFRSNLQSSGRGGGALAPANFLDYRAQVRAFSHIAAYQSRNFNFAEPGQPAEQLRSLLVTGDFFPLLGIAPELGRGLTADDDRPGHSNVIVINHAMWLQRFGADPAIIGRSVRVDGEPVTVVGVMPAAFDDYMAWGNVDAWRPLALSENQRVDRDNHYIAVIARLAPGVTLGQAQAEGRAVAARLAADYPKFNAGAGLNLVTLAASLQDETGRRITWLVMGLSVFVLLIACANLANLQLARNASRQREHAIRAALGASRGRLMQGVLQESLLLSLCGGLLGLLLAFWGNSLLGRVFPWGDRVGIDLSVDPKVIGFAFAASVFTGLIFGLVPAWIVSRAHANESLQQGGRSNTASREQHRLRSALIVAEIALAVVLLAGAGFFRDGLQRLVARDAGWRVDGLLTAYVTLRGQAYTDTAARTAFFQRVQERLARIPGVESTAVASSLPTFGFSNSVSFAVEGRPEPKPGQALNTTDADVTPGYFATLGMRLLEGRDFNENDRPDTPTVVIINEAMARALWPGESPIGKRIGGLTPFMSKPRTIVGVVSNVRSIGVLGNNPERFETYRALAQRPPTNVTIAIRAGLAPEALAPDLRRAVREIDAVLAIYRVSTVREEARRSLAGMDVAGWSLASLAGLGLLLAAIGIYGVVAHSVTQRTSEFGLRLALGAQVRDVFALVVHGGLRFTLLGAVIGIGGALGLDRLLSAISPEFAHTNPLVLVGVTLLLAFIALLACWLPARRATRVDPMVALRAE